MVTKELMENALRYIMDDVYKPLTMTPPASVNRICQRFSWLDEEAIANHAAYKVWCAKKRD